MEIQQTEIKHKGRTIAVTIYQPDQCGKCPVIIFSHGFNGSGDDFREQALTMAQQGIGAVCYDFCGGSVHSRSSMDTKDMTIFTEQEDLYAVMDEVKSWEWAAADKILIFGASQGGLVSALAAEERGDEICGMVLLFPALCIAEDWRKRFASEADIPETFDLWGMTIGKSFFMSIRDFYVFDHIGQYKGPVLLMHGDKDDVVNIGYSRRAAGMYPNLHYEVFEGEGHGFSPEGNRKVTELLQSFCGRIR